MMKKGKCIYCKQERDLSKEHAFPESLLDDRLIGTEHEWIIDKHLCEKCNKFLGKQLDEILIGASPIGFIWNGIKGELGKTTKDQQATFYKSAKAHRIHPVRFLFPDPSRDDWILLHEEKPASSNTEVPVDWVTPLSPQIIIIQSSKDQSFEDARTENLEKFNAFGSDEIVVTKYDERNKVYYNFGNTLIFPPETTKELLRKPAQRDEFRSKFLIPGHRVDCRIICPRQDNLHSPFMSFFKSLKSEEKSSNPKFVVRVTHDRVSLKPGPYRDKGINRITKAVFDPKAGPYINRSIAKIAFHCFLFHYPKFSGHEPLFDDIREFIHKGGSSERFVIKWKIPKIEKLVYKSNQLFHIICFYARGNRIGCTLNLFTGLLTKPFSFWINLAGTLNNSTRSPSRVEHIPFYVHPKSQRRRRIFVSNRVELMWN